MRRNFRVAVIVAFGVPLLVAFWVLVALDLETGSQTAAAVHEQGRRLYREWGCGTCHGNDGRGGPRGPNLRGVADHWQTDTLTDYLKNPAEFRKHDSRLRALSRRYAPISMPAAERLTDHERALIARYLLRRPR